MNKLEFKVKALETIDSFFDQVEKLEQKKDDLSDGLKKEYEKQILALKDRKTELLKKLDDLEKGSKNITETAREAYLESLKRYKTSFNKLTQLFK